MRRTIAMFIALMAMAAVGHAQAPAISFGELRSRLSIGETVFVTNRAGKTVKGTVQQVTDTILVLRSGPDDLTLAASDVQRVARRGHTVRNGALIGLAAGFVVGGAWAAGADEWYVHVLFESCWCSRLRWALRSDRHGCRGGSGRIASKRAGRVRFGNDRPRSGGDYGVAAAGRRRHARADQLVMKDGVDVTARGFRGNPQQPLEARSLTRHAADGARDRERRG